MTLQMQKELARLIRVGIDSGVVEFSHAWGMEVISLLPVANVVGFALIGKVGKDRAIDLFRRANDATAKDDPAVQELYRELQVTTEELKILFKAGLGLAAMDIADKLDAGLYDELALAA